MDEKARKLFILYSSVDRLTKNRDAELSKCHKYSDEYLDIQIEYKGLINGLEECIAELKGMDYE